MSRRIGAPSMFHRRLAWLALLMTFAILVLGGQMTRLTVVKGQTLRAKAERALDRRRVLPTYRGRILDRRGRVLAVDEPGYALAIDYRVLTGEWIERAAADAAQAATGRSAWRELTDDAKRAAIEMHRPDAVAQHTRLWAEVARRTGVSPIDLEARRRQIIDRVHRIERDVYARQKREQAEQYGIDLDAYDFTPRPLREHRQAHVVVSSVEDRVAYDLRALSSELPGMIEIVEERRRLYPWQAAEVIVERGSMPRPLASPRPLAIQVEGVADHILGTMRDVKAEDVARRPFRDDDDRRDLGGYRTIDDRAGAWGIEHTFEDLLRGERGLVREHASTGTTERIEPVVGQDVTLTIDVALQARLQALMSDEVGLLTVQPFHQNRPTLPSGMTFNGAAVVLEIETGELLAMVSMPTLARGRSLRAIDPLRDDIDHPVVNRPVEGVYPPGSIIKPLVLAAGIGEGVHSLEEPIVCTGHYFPNNRSRARCWIYRERWSFQTHGPLGGANAIAQSCNIYFYTLADRLGIGGLTSWLTRFGLGQPLDVGLLREQHWTDSKNRVHTRQVGEHGGKLLAPAEIASIAPAERRSTRVSFGIGQGRCVLWTPVQAANAFATLARGGVMRDATLVAGDPRGTRVPRPDVPITPGVLDAVLTGLHGSVSAGGTGYQITYEPGDAEPIFNARGVKVWGKTGTAQAPPLRLVDTDGDGDIDVHDGDPLRELDHAWFVGLVGPEDTGRPMFVIAAIVEYGGSGGRVAGPLANQIILALQAEGYLPALAMGEAERGGP